MRARPAPTRSVRCFIAVELSPEVCRLLGERQRALAVILPADSVRWVRPEGTHLTLKFLGDVALGRLAELDAAMRSAVEGQPCLEVEVGGLGCFPSARRPRVIWVGVQDASGGLGRIQRAIEDSLERIGFAREVRPFSPHLTLGRLHEGLPALVAGKVGEALQAAEAGGICVMPVRAVKLFRSELRPGGAVYTALREMTLEEAR
jgi:2'-5' RNA ligase